MSSPSIRVVFHRPYCGAEFNPKAANVVNVSVLRASQLPLAPGGEVATVIFRAHTKCFVAALPSGLSQDFDTTSWPQADAG